MKVFPFIIALIFHFTNAHCQDSKSLLDALRENVDGLNVYRFIGPPHYQDNNYYRLAIFTDTLIVLTNKSGGKDGDYFVGESELHYHFNVSKELYLYTEDQQGDNFEYGGRSQLSTMFKFVNTQDKGVFTDTVIFRYSLLYTNSRTKEERMEEVADTLRYQPVMTSGDKMKFRLPGYNKLSQH